ncbi:MAG: chromophore lyase CpcT/CpeT [Planctomycetes bacterium]|nr:chromophore lyase CpcT/CpeT [Planctomycetota bacterium]
MIRSVGFTAVIVLCGCAGAPERGADPRAVVEEAVADIGISEGLGDLATALIGTFSSRAQAERDARYFAVRIVTVPIWPERWTDQAWLYVEQALESAPNHPYRQRIYRVRDRGDGRFTSDVYELPGDPLRFVAMWTDPDPIVSIAPDDLVRREGCTVELRRVDGGFRGGTAGEGCASTRAGASYATSEVAIASDAVESWDRGFDASGQLVWGAEVGPYRFDRVSDGVPARGDAAD